jgi:hypothetical protein
MAHAGSAGWPGQRCHRRFHPKRARFPAISRARRRLPAMAPDRSVGWLYARVVRDSVTVHIAAPADQFWDLVSDVAGSGDD